MRPKEVDGWNLVEVGSSELKLEDSSIAEELAASYISSMDTYVSKYIKKSIYIWYVINLYIDVD